MAVSRCACEGFYGTVRFVGELPSTKGNVWRAFDFTVGYVTIAPKESGLEWSGTTPREGSTAVVTKVSSISRAGKNIT